MDLFDTPRTAIGTISWAAGCLVSTPEDLTNWWKAYFDNFLTEDSKTQAMDFQVWPGVGVNLGLGLMELEINGENYQGHGGQTIGYNAFSASAPDNRHVLTVSINNAFGEALLVLRDLVAALDAVTSTNEVRKKEFDFSIFPNPASQDAQINITLPSISFAQMVVTNSNGTIVKNEALGRLNEGENQIPISLKNLPNGSYFLKIWGKNLAPIVQRIVIIN